MVISNQMGAIKDFGRDLRESHKVARRGSASRRAMPGAAQAVGSCRKISSGAPGRTKRPFRRRTLFRSGAGRRRQSAASCDGRGDGAVKGG